MTQAQPGVVVSDDVGVGVPDGGGELVGGGVDGGGELGGLVTGGDDTSLGGDGDGDADLCECTGGEL
jgi:hypothetical protein